MLVNVYICSYHVWINRLCSKEDMANQSLQFGSKLGAGIKAQHKEALKLAAGFGERWEMEEWERTE